jgi:RTX calcium-binding nonapeptide repeat (4 copies)
MAKFIAKQPTSNLSLQGISILASPANVSFSNRESDGFIAQSQTVRLEIGGEDFHYFGGRPKATGTITDIKYYTSGTLYYKITKMNLDLHDIASTNNLALVTKSVFAKDDIIKGSFGNDTLAGFKGKDKLDGKAGADTLQGDGGKDILIGGDGADILDGGKGKDTYVFKSAAINGVDKILKFQDGEILQFKSSKFDGLTKGELSPDQFVVGTAPADADDRFIYDPSTGYLYHDPDGFGGVAKTLVVIMQPKLDDIFDAHSIFVI